MGAGVTGLIWALFILMCCLSLMLYMARWQHGPHERLLTYSLTASLLTLLFALYLAGTVLAS